MIQDISFESYYMQVMIQDISFESYYMQVMTQDISCEVEVEVFRFCTLLWRLFMKVFHVTRKNQEFLYYFQDISIFICCHPKICPEAKFRRKLVLKFNFNF